MNVEALKRFLEVKITASPHAALRVEPPAITGAGDVLLAAGYDTQCVVYAGVRHGGESLRIGFAAKNRWMNEEVEDAVESNGGDMTEFLEDEMEADDALPFKVQHFHEAGWFHFASDLAKPSEFFDTDEGHELAWYFFDGYARAILPIMAKAAAGED